MLCHWQYVLENLFGKPKALSCLGATHIHERIDDNDKPYRCTADDSAYATFGLGGEYMIIPLVAAGLFGVKVLRRLMGVILTVDGVAEAVTPMIVAKIRDTTGSHDAGFMLLTGLAFTGLLVISFLPRSVSKNRAIAGSPVHPSE